MTVYVDNHRIPATLGGITGRWSHLTADTPEQLQTFAARIGLRPAWFQARCRYATCPAPTGVCVHYHYDVIDAVRTRAIRAGAVPIAIRDLGALVTARRAAGRQQSGVVR